MSRHIKGPVARWLAQAIFRAIGECLTGVAKEALRDLYAAIEGRTRKRRVEEPVAIADQVAAHAKHPCVDHAQLLHDGNGVPK